MTPWLPIPRAIAADPALSMLSLAAQAVVLRLALAAVDGALPVPAGRTGADVAEVVCARAPGVREGYAEAHAAGVVAEDDGALVLAWEWPVLGAGRESADDGALRDTVARKRLRALFSKHRLDTADARTAWLATDAGRAALARLGLDDDVGAKLAAGAGRRGGRFGFERPARRQPAEATNGGNRLPPTEATTGATVASNHGSNLALSPHTPLSEKREKEERKESERAPANGSNPAKQPRATDGSNQSGGNPRPALDADDLDGALTVAAKGRIDLRAAARLKVNLLSMLREFGVTRADIPQLAAAMDPAKLWPWAKLTPPVTVSWLLGKPGPSGEYDAARLQEWVTAARALPAEAPPRPSRASTHRDETPEEATARMTAFGGFRKRPASAPEAT